MTEFDKWDSFYLIVGAAAGALIGLQFVVLTLISNRTKPPRPEAGATFATPTIIHFGAVLLLSALLRAPWQTILSAAALWGLIGVAGVVYEIVIIRRMRAQNFYQPEFEDWLCHAHLPLAAYLILGVSAFTAHSFIRESLFGVGAAALLLLFTGIHNAWDAVTYHVFVEARDSAPQTDEEDSDSES